MLGYGNGTMPDIASGSQTTTHIQAPQNHYPTFQEPSHNQISQPGNQGYHHQGYPNMMPLKEIAGEREINGKITSIMMDIKRWEHEVPVILVDSLLEPETTKILMGRHLILCIILITSTLMLTWDQMPTCLWARTRKMSRS